VSPRHGLAMACRIGIARHRQTTGNPQAIPRQSPGSPGFGRDTHMPRMALQQRLPRLQRHAVRLARVVRDHHGPVLARIHLLVQLHDRRCHVRVVAINVLRLRATAVVPPPLAHVSGASTGSQIAVKTQHATATRRGQHQLQNTGKPIDAPCTQCLRHGDPMHAQEWLTAAKVALRR
jgi:hypothetical protein